MNRWLHAQRLGVTASVLVTHSGTHPAFRAARKILQADMTTGRAQARSFDFFRSLPPWVLTVLARAFKQRLAPRLNTFAVLAEKALQHNLIGREDDTSTMARAQIWAYHVLLSHTRTDGLLRLGRTLFGHYEQWLTIHSSPLSREEIARHLATIRDPLVSTPEKCHAIGKLGRILGKTPFWEQIENILYHNQFCWPLVVFDSASAQSGPQALALSLPVAVDIRFDNRGEVRQTTGAGVLAPKWEKQLEKAVHAAKTLWRSEHENCGRFRDMVDAASVTLDVSFAERIVETLAKALNAKVSLSDRSAEAYFAEVVLGRFLRRSNVMVSAVTGVIGDQTKNNDENDRPSFPFWVPQGMVEKIQYAATTGFLERIVLPEARESRDAAADSLKWLHLRDQEEPKKSSLGNQLLEVLYAEDLESLSDHVLPVGWRRHWYIRCPELEWAIHGTGISVLIKPSDDKRVRDVVARLASNDSAVIKLEVSPMVAASALCHIDDCLRRNQPMLSGGLSWSFINVSEGKTSVRWDDEKDIFFWELFFKAMNAGPSHFQSFLRRPSREEAVKNLGAYLNRFVPTPDQPHRCPDLIVLIGRQTLFSSTGRSRTPSGRPFMVNPILEELKDTLRPIGKPNDPLWQLIGKTRIIILPDATPEEPTGQEDFLIDLTPEEMRQLSHLSTLEDSFTGRTAGLVLSWSGGSLGATPTHEILEKFLRKGLIRYIHGKYHVPSAVARQIPPEGRPEDSLKRYYAAAAALAPYVIGGQGALSMAVDVAFTPGHFEEANQHFRQALYLSRKTGSAEAGRLRKSCEEAVRRLIRFVMPPSWANVSRLLKGANRLQGLAALEPYEKACELLRWYEEAKIPAHPFHLVTAAGSAIRAASCISLYVENPDVPSAFRTRCDESPLQLHVKAKVFYLDALKRCDALPKNEREITRLFCLTRYLAYLCERHWELLGHETPSDREEKEMEIQVIWSAVAELMNRRVKLYIADGLECFERMGDRESDHGKALDIYLKGIGTGLFWSPLSLKAWGAASLCGRPEHLNSMLRGFPDHEKGHLVYKAFYRLAAREAKAAPHEKARAKEGIRAFEYFFGNDPNVKATKAAFYRDYGRDAVLRWVEDEGAFSRGVVSELKQGEQHGFLRSEQGGLYRFQTFHLVEGLAYDDLFVGMELDFRVLKESSGGRVGDAMNIRKPLRPGESPFQTGRVSALKPEDRYGFISSGGKEYHFHASHLAEGLAHSDLYEGMWVTFQIVRAQPKGRTDEATNISPIKDDDTSGVPDFSRATGVTGTISELKHQGKYGFIMANGKEYHFHASHLTGGLGYQDIHEGMDIEFDIIRESTDIRCGQARRIRMISDTDQSNTAQARASANGTKGATRVSPTTSQVNPTGVTQQGRVCLFKQDGRYGFLSSEGTDYHFTAADLRGGLTNRNVYEGMEVEFTVSRERTERASPRAANVRLLNSMTDWLSPAGAKFIIGRISFVKVDSTYGFINALDGTDYYFSSSDLRGGLIFDSLREGMEVEFQVRNAAKGDQAPEAMNVRPLPRGRASKSQPDCEPPQCVRSRGSISFIKQGGDYGFIRSVNGRDYQFHESDLSQDIDYQDLCLGKEVEFQILREGKHGNAGKAIQVRPATGSARESLPVQRGVVYCLVLRLRCGFISAENGEEYQFTESDLIGGLKYEDIRECTNVTFQIRKKPGTKAGKAVHVALLDE